MNGDTGERKPVDHDLKLWPEFFDDVEAGRMTFQLRKNDRNYAVGDTLRLREFQPEMVGGSQHEWQKSAGVYTGREVKKRVVYIMGGIGPGGVKPYHGLVGGYAILGIGD